MPSHWKDLLDFTHSERNGFIILIIAVVILSLLPRVYPIFLPTDKDDFTEIKKLIEDLEKAARKDSIDRLAQENEEIDRTQLNTKAEGFKKTPIPKKLYPFDPNKVSYLEMLELGFNKKVAHTIVNYREKGGRFYKIQDLRKIYGLKESDFQRLKEYIVLGKDAITNDDKKLIDSIKVNSSLKRNENIIVEINSADSLSLIRIKGVGPAFSSRILKYRKLLGGFKNKNQLLEVYGMDSIRLKKIEHQIKIDTSLIDKIDLNIVEWIDLVSHPYISKEIANNIINHRKYNGLFEKASDIESYYLVNKRLYRKIAPYIIVHDRGETKKND